LLKPYLVVYSPKDWDEQIHETFLSSIESSPHVLCTLEWGPTHTHKHANYFFYHSVKDSYDLKRKYKMKKPLWDAKAVTSINNVITYMTKEGKLTRILAHNDRLRASEAWARRSVQSELG